MYQGEPAADLLTGDISVDRSRIMLKQNGAKGAPMDIRPVSTDVSYRIDRAHDPAEDVAIAFNDPELAIRWPLPVAAMSQRDLLAPPLAAAMAQLG